MVKLAANCSHIFQVKLKDHMFAKMIWDSRKTKLLQDSRAALTPGKSGHLRNLHSGIKQCLPHNTINYNRCILSDVKNNILEQEGYPISRSTVNGNCWQHQSCLYVKQSPPANH